ncbi:Ig domain-containing protein [Kitasatospora viridis]|uniref:Putative Ig domain-containing protein n=1 Tax=Kitasatospora viridis TaxID=281105 RepID=A0A561T7G7_9ACTN|nr:Ig domain-containing protein [Kitasatospora viridis]TWF83054.1 putative Ig domain-containing protein [Kitasatospora viridis]
MPIARSRTGGSLKRLLLTVVALGVATAGLTGTAGAQAQPTPPSAGSATGSNTHPAGEGWQQINGTWVQLGASRPHVMPNATTFAKQQAAQAAAAKSGGTGGGATAQAATPNGIVTPDNNYDLQMTYRGGQDSIGVTTGAPKVYLVLWGNQWGKQGTDPATGDATFTGDPDQAVPYQQEFFKGLGSSTDTWSKVMTQYCEGIPAASDYCPTTANHTGFPLAGQTLAGIWYDNSAPSPQAATEPQIAAEAVAAAKHFGNVQANQNRNVQYVIDTPQGEDSDKWKELGYCAWHTFTRTASSGTLAYTLMPYLTDVGACGTNWINPGPRGRLDGYGIIGGHEYAETITDQNPSGAWTDATGQEIGDKCSWIQVGRNGGMFNLQLSTGSFPVQTMWSNYDHLCMGNDPLFTNTPLLVTQPCEQSLQVGKPVDIPVLASDAAGRPISYSAKGLPSGLKINATTGHITGTTKATGWKTITVTGKDDQGNNQSQTFKAGFFTGPQVGCAPIEQLNDAGFENGTSDHYDWNPSGYNIITPSSAHQAHTGNGYAWLGQDTATDDSITQWVETTPGYSQEHFSFWLNITGNAQGTSAATGAPLDTLSLELYDQYTGNYIGTVRTWNNLNATNGYQLQQLDLTPFVAPEFGSTVGIKLVAHETSGKTAFLIDDASVKLT